MEDKSKSSVAIGGFCGVGGDTPLYPPSYGWQPSLLYNQHFGLPPILDFRDLSWMESIHRKLWTSSWSGYTRSVEFTPRPGLKVHREMGSGVSEVTNQGCKWRVSLDVNHFAPPEITVMTQDGFLIVGGKHEERQDEHGYISRNFIRKYRLPDGVESSSIYTFITGDGVLTVEVPLPVLPQAADSNITVQVEMKVPKLEDPKMDGRPRAELPEQGVLTSMPVGKPKEKPLGAIEMVLRIDGTPEDLRYQEGVNVAEETVRIQEEDKKRKKLEGERIMKMEEEGAEERVISGRVTDVVPGLVEEHKPPTAPEKPDAPQHEKPGRDGRVQEMEEERSMQDRNQEPVQKPDLEGQETHVKPEEVKPVQTQEEIQTQLDITKQRAIELMRKTE